MCPYGHIAIQRRHIVEPFRVPTFCEIRLGCRLSAPPGASLGSWNTGRRRCVCDQYGGNADRDAVIVAAHLRSG